MKPKFTVKRLTAALALIALGLLVTQLLWGQNNYPDPRRIFNWSPQEQLLAYKSVEKFLPTHAVKTGTKVVPLPPPQDEADKKIATNLAAITEEFMKTSNIVGVLIFHKGHLLVERYGHGFTENDRWTTFSVAKSITSTLVGAAVKDGYISSLDDQVIKYVPELKNSAYDGVSIRHLLTMTSGVKWNENYYDPKSDTSKIAFGIYDQGQSMLNALARLPRESKPGRKFVYKTGESNLLGLVVQRATQRSLADYLSEKIWVPFGMEKSAFWAVDSQDSELGGCCLSMCLRDYGRFGLFMLEGGLASDKEVLPAGWIKEATTDRAGRSYGYQWRLLGDGSYMASGIFGQLIYINPKTQTVGVVLSAWATPTSNQGNKARYEYMRQVGGILATGAAR